MEEYQQQDSDVNIELGYNPIQVKVTIPHIVSTWSEYMQRLRETAGGIMPFDETGLSPVYTLDTIIAEEGPIDPKVVVDKQFVTQVVATVPKATYENTLHSLADKLKDPKAKQHSKLIQLLIRNFRSAHRAIQAKS